MPRLKRAATLIALVTTLTSCLDGQHARKDEPITPEPAPRATIAGTVEVVDSSDDPALGGEPLADDAEVGLKVVQPPLDPSPSPDPSPRLPLSDPRDTVKTLTAHFDTLNAAQIHVQTDKPLYRPGESIWIRAWLLNKRERTPLDGAGGALLQLISPKGAVVMEKRVQAVGDLTTNDFELPLGVPGGEYIIRVQELGGRAVEERPVIVSSYEPPRIKKTLDFVQKAYGPGDEVAATLKIERATGEPLANKALEGRVRLDGQELPAFSIRTNEHGGAVARFSLPAQIEAGDGLLTVMVEDGGVTESISRRVPIVLDKVRLTLFPEGGQLVEGLAGRVYFQALDPLGEPADVRGLVVDDQGREVATFASHHDGLGRFDLTPRPGRTYHARITAPTGIKEHYKLDNVAAQGCALTSFDDLDGQIPALRVAVRCSSPREVIVTAVHQSRLIDAARVAASPDAAAVVHLKAKDDALALAQGVARVTVWDMDRNPLAERLVYRNRRNTLRVEIQPSADHYGPRDTAELSVRTFDAQGRPTPASLALSVVDDTVLSYADDETGHMLSRLLLEQELPQPVEDPNFYLDLTEPKSALAVDLLMGTLGWRRFDWKLVFDPPPVVTRRDFNFDDVLIDGALAMPQGAMLERAEEEGPAFFGVAEAPQAAEPEIMNEPPAIAAEARIQAIDAQPALGGLDLGANVFGGDIAQGQHRFDVGRQAAARDMDWEGAKNERFALQWAPMRVFPVPAHKPGFEGPRTDFRDTIFWAPEVKTDDKGEAKVSFPLSDAITSFRVSAEGVGAGALGRAESVIASSLPFSMTVKLPLEVTRGDAVRMPLTLTNNQSADLQVRIEATFGEGLAFEGEPAFDLSLPAGSRKSLIFPVKVEGGASSAAVSFKASAGALSDSFERTLAVVAPGFPQSFSAGGELEHGKATYELDLTGAIEGTLSGVVKLYPSPVATMVSGLEGMLRQPGGCFEQASSTNYPNLMVMQYLKQHQVEDPALWQRSGALLDDGYRLLTGYESKQKGYEWFGGDPGHEALTAYGLMEFADMKGVYSGVDAAMLERTAAWLRGRRDGKGGYLRNDRALDSFGQAAAPVTDAYITWALVEAGFGGPESRAEIEAQARAASTVQDPYLLALATSTLLKSPGFEDKGREAARRLARLQDKDGSFKGADHSITRSGGENLLIESTALAALALLEANAHPEPVMRAVKWLNGNRSGFGQWGTTQATVLALKAMSRYAASSRRTRSAGSITVLVNGALAGEVAYKEGHRDTIAIEGLVDHLKAGRNTIEVIHEGKESMPFSVLVEHRSATPATSPQATIDLTTEIDRADLRLGEVARLTARVRNTTDKGQPMVLARVGLPGGLTSQTWQLKELRDKGLIAFYETRPREVILYFRDMKPNEIKEIPIDLATTTPGTYEAPASSAYLYYTDEHKTWRAGLTVTVR